MAATWVLVADRARARLFAREGRGDALVEIADYLNPDGRAHGVELTRGKPPRTQESVGSARHAIEPRTTPQRRSATRFARELADVLEQGRAADRYGELVLVAPSRFLGTLRKSITKPVGERLGLQVDKDLTAAAATDIEALVAPDRGD